MNISVQVIKLFLFMVLLVFENSCNSVKRSDVEFELIEIFSNMPEIDENQTTVGIGEIQLIIKVSNDRKKNRYLKFTNLGTIEEDKIDCSFSLVCNESGEEAKIGLHYITSPTVLLQKNETDTIVLRADFRDLLNYFPNCINKTRMNELKKEKGIIFEYKSENNSVLSNNGKNFYPLNFYKKKIDF